MTDQEIIKAAECCSKAQTRGDCMRLKCPACVPEGCVYYNRSEPDCEDGVYVEIWKDLLAIITRQQAEIERWQEIHADAMEFLRIATDCRRSE